LRDGQRRTSVGVEHHGLMDVVAAPLQRRSHRQLSDVYECPVERGALRRQRADTDRVNTFAVHVARNLDAAALREGVDQAVVADVGVFETALPGDKRVDIARGELALALDREIDAR